jgi:hypothetical protein
MWTERDVKVWERDNGIYYVQIPGRAGWKSTGQRNRKQAIAWALREAEGGAHTDTTLAQYAADFFIPGKCPLIAIQEGRGKRNGVKHWETLRQLHVSYILLKWGRYTLPAIQARDVFTWLSKLRQVRGGVPLSAQTKNKIIVTLNAIYDYAVFDGLSSPTSSGPCRG